MFVVDFFKIVDLKKELDAKFGIKLHVHDCCSMQYFSFDDAVSDEVIIFIKEYFVQERSTVVFDEGKKSFYLD